MTEQGIMIMGVRVDAVPGWAVLAKLATKPASASWQISYVNAHSLNLAREDAELRAALGGSTLVLNDGFGVTTAALMRGRRFAENLNGTDFTHKILEFAAEQSWRVFLYGGQPGVASAAATRLMRLDPRLYVVGTQHGYINDDTATTRAVRDSHADLLLVALGQPKQEIWLANNLAETECQLGVGVGAFFDFVSGRVGRAPAWARRFGLEWCFRLMSEPRRLAHRYVLGNPVFLWSAWRSRAEDQGQPPDR